MKEYVNARAYSDPKRTEAWLLQVRESGWPMEKLSPIQLAHCATEQNCKMKECCVMCGHKIEVMCYRNTGVCSELCRKDRDQDHGSARARTP